MTHDQVEQLARALAEIGCGVTLTWQVQPAGVALDTKLPRKPPRVGVNACPDVAALISVALKHGLDVSYTAGRGFEFRKHPPAPAAGA